MTRRAGLRSSLAMKTPATQAVIALVVLDAGDDSPAAGAIRPTQLADADDRRPDEQDERGDRDDVHGHARGSRRPACDRRVEERVRVPADDRAADHRVDRPRRSGTPRSTRTGSTARDRDPGANIQSSSRYSGAHTCRISFDHGNGGRLVERDVAQQQVVDDERRRHVRHDRGPHEGCTSRARPRRAGRTTRR